MQHGEQGGESHTNEGRGLKQASPTSRSTSRAGSRSGQTHCGTAHYTCIRSFARQCDTGSRTYALQCDTPPMALSLLSSLTSNGRQRDEAGDPDAHAQVPVGVRKPCERVVLPARHMVSRPGQHGHLRGRRGARVDADAGGWGCCSARRLQACVNRSRAQPFKQCTLYSSRLVVVSGVAVPSCVAVNGCAPVRLAFPPQSSPPRPAFSPPAIPLGHSQVSSTSTSPSRRSSCRFRLSTSSRV